MAGGGNILSKKALTKFVTILLPNSTLCPRNDGTGGDLLVGQCLNKFAIFLDARDDKNQKQIFPLGVEMHMKNEELNMSNWYAQYLWRNVTQGGLECCSDTYIGSHYIRPLEMNLMQFLIYHLHPYGITKNLTEKFPRKLSLEEILKASDDKSVFASNYLEHERIHYIDDDEKY